MPNRCYQQVFVAMVLTVLLAACSGPPTLKPLSKNATILAFGDSLTYGTGTTKTQSYPATLASLTGRRVINAGVPGEVSADGLKRLPGLLAEHKPDLLILIHGGNDMLRRRSFAQAADNVRAMVNLARERNTDVILLAVPKPGLILSPPEFYQQIALGTDIPIEEDVISDILQYSANKSDAVHPNAKGYRILAEEIVELLKDEGAL